MRRERIRQAVWTLLDRHQIPVSDDELPKFLRISDAIEAAAKGRTEEMKRKLRTTGALAIAYAGDIPLERLDLIVSDLMIWLIRPPKVHGRSHGRNRHDQPRKTSRSTRRLQRPIAPMRPST